MTAPMLTAPMVSEASGCLCGGGVPLTISWSALRTHRECHQKHKLVYTGHKSPAADLRTFFHGIVVDAAMRRWLRAGPRPGQGRGQMASWVDEIIEAQLAAAAEAGDGVVRWRYATDRADMTAWCADLLTRLEPLLDELVLPFDYQPGWRFRVPIHVPFPDGRLATVLLVGELDVLVRYPDGGWGLWDLKGTADDSYWQKTIGQLLFYDVAVSAAFGAPAASAGLIQPMCTQPVIRARIAEADRQVLMADVVAMCHDIWTRDFSLAADSTYCPSCAVKFACPRFEPVMLSRPVTIPLASR